MKFLKILLIILVVLAVAFVGISFTLPGEYMVERSLTINAPSDSVFVLVGDFGTWPDWTAWNTTNYPGMEYTHGETLQGVGAEQSWTFDGGKGHMIFTAASDSTGVAYDLTFDEVYKSQGGLRFEAVDGGTKVTWYNGGKLDGIVARYFGLIMDGAMGPDFEAGLSGLKKRVEGE